MPTIKVTTGLLSTADIVNDIVDALLSDDDVDIEEDGLTGTLIVSDKKGRKELEAKFVVELSEEKENGN